MTLREQYENETGKSIGCLFEVQTGKPSYFFAIEYAEWLESKFEIEVNRLELLILEQDAIIKSLRESKIDEEQKLLDYFAGCVLPYCIQTNNGDNAIEAYDRAEAMLAERNRRIVMRSKNAKSD